MRSRVLGALASILILAACEASPAATSRPSTITPATATSPVASSFPVGSAGQALAWTRCGEGTQCAGLRVPLDYSTPDGKTITLALIRRPATDKAHRIGSIVINPGGPGGSGVDTVRQGPAMFSPGVMARFDVVGFDPRGVGASSAVQCLIPRSVLAQLTEPYPRDPSEVAEWLAVAKAEAAACQANSGDLLPYVGTENVARDLDRIRAALGDEKLTYEGTSYGTLIGALYADMFPTHIRAMVLDAPLDPSLDITGLSAGEARGYQRQLDKFLSGCAKDPSCAFTSGGKARAAFDALMARFAQAPIGGVSAALAWAAVELELIANDHDKLAVALDAASKGDASSMEDIAGWMLEPGAVDAHAAVICADYRTSRTPDGIATLADELERVSPDFGSMFAWGSLGCAYWPFESTRVPKAVKAVDAPPILIVAATGDPATPYEWGQALSKQLSSSVLLTRDGDGHGSLGTSDCIDDIFESYVLDLATPKPGTTCS